MKIYVPIFDGQDEEFHVDVAFSTIAKHEFSDEDVLKMCKAVISHGDKI